MCFCFRVLCMQSQDKFEILIVFVPVPDVVVRYFCFVSSARWTYPGTLIKYLHLKEHTVKLVDRKSTLWERNYLVKDLKTDSLVFCFIKCGVVPFHFPFSMNLLVLHYSISLIRNSLAWDTHEPPWKKYDFPYYRFYITLKCSAWGSLSHRPSWRDSRVLQ